MTTMTMSGTLLTALRQQAPLVQCITNFVAMNVAANVLLAAGASPAMVHAEQEAGEFAGFAGAVTINIGTISADWLTGMTAAARAANSGGTPWILDPVAHHATRFRRSAVADLLALQPTVIRGNASEIIALAGGHSRSRGVDSGDAVRDAEAAATALARSQACVVAVTGAVDFVTDGEQAARVEGGCALMPQVTALGCALTCLVGAFAAIRPRDPFAATLAALATFAVAGTQAGTLADGPGSFAWRFLDTLAALDAETLDRQARISAA